MDALTTSHPITVKLSNGTPVTANVQQLRIKDFPGLLVAIDDEPVAAELYCGKTRGWSDTLSDESIVAICEKGEAINEAFFVPWARRRMSRQAKLIGLDMAKLSSASSKPTAPSLQPDAVSAS